MKNETAKEKAKELVTKCMGVRWDIPTSDGKLFALIAVDEIISIMINLNGREIEDNNSQITKWQDVKAEIEKL